ncbi:MAG TPA: dihydroorotate dehydrogenase-like protein, partial [Acidimicrobiia bacterium]
MSDLRTTYLGLDLANPIVPSASPLGGHPDTARRLEAAGAAAIVLPSLFEEEIEREALNVQSLAHHASESQGEATSGYFPIMPSYATGPDNYLRHVEDLKRHLIIPVIASLNGTTVGGWTRYARLLEEAGADALELNIYLLATDLEASSSQVESRYLELVTAVRATTSLPLAVKVGPYFSSIPYMARSLVEAGADGLVLFNRFYQPDLDLEEMAVLPSLHLSSSNELLVPLRWIAILAGRVEASLAATTGIHTAEDVVKALLVRADVAMMASALLKRGPEYLSTVLAGLERWLEANEYES